MIIPTPFTSSLAPTKQVEGVGRGGGAQRNPQARHSRRPEAGRLPHPPSGHRDAPRRSMTPSSTTCSTHGVEMLFGHECRDLHHRGRRAAWASCCRATAGEREICARSTPSSPRAAAARTGWNKSAPSTASPISPAPWTSACAWKCATRSWRLVNERAL